MQLPPDLPFPLWIHVGARDDGPVALLVTNAGAAPPVHGRNATDRRRYGVDGGALDALLDALRDALQEGRPVAGGDGSLVPTASPRGGYGLSDREREVLALLADGLAQKEIAEALHVSPATVNKHVQRVYHKLEVRSASGAVAKALRERLV